MNRKEIHFVPATGLSNSHLMTLAPLLMRRRFPLTERSGREIFLPVAPQNQVSVKLHKAPATSPLADYLVVVLHGLESNADVHYVRGVCEKALHEGFSVARMNMRNCGGTSHLATTLYNAGMSGDVLTVASQLCLQDNFKGVFLCGFSLGGNVVLKAAAEHATAAAAGRSDFPLSGVCSICPPIDLEGCVSQMEKGINRIYEKNFVLSLKLRIYEKARLFPGKFDLKLLRTVRTVRGFDNAFTAPDAGYGSAEEYYAAASSGRVLNKIAAPTLIIAAQDDPLVPFSCFADIAAEADAQPDSADRKIFKGEILTPLNGGHVAFIHNQEMVGPLRAGPKDPFWAEWQAVNYFRRLTTGGAVD